MKRASDHSNTTRNPRGARGLGAGGCGVLAALFLVCAPPVQAWDEAGHAIVTRLACEKLPADMPKWLKEPAVCRRLEYLSSEPDRWRGQHNVHLDHANNPNHYIDIEDFELYGLTLATLPPLRREFIDVLAGRRIAHPDKFGDYERRRDPSYTKLSPGLLPYEIAELQWKVAASWTTLKTYEQYRSYVTDEMIDNARQNIVYQMGIISHFIGDGSQPLHTTRHHNGWVGSNPKGYTTDRGFHAYIDGGAIEDFRITAESIGPRAKAPRAIPNERYWAEICRYLGETFAGVEPLYQLEKSGDLRKDPGKRFIEDRLIEGGSALAGFWVAAYQGAVIDDFRVQRLTGGKKPAVEEKP